MVRKIKSSQAVLIYNGLVELRQISIWLKPLYTYLGQNIKIKDILWVRTEVIVVCQSDKHIRAKQYTSVPLYNISIVQKKTISQQIPISEKNAYITGITIPSSIPSKRRSSKKCSKYLCQGSILFVFTIFRLNSGSNVLTIRYFCFPFYLN